VAGRHGINTVDKRRSPMDGQRVKTGWKWIKFIIRCFQGFSTGGQKDTADKIGNVIDVVEGKYRNRD